MYGIRTNNTENLDRVGLAIIGALDIYAQHEFSSDHILIEPFSE